MTSSSFSEGITPLASLSLTHVYYNPSDPLSHLSAYLALLPQALIIVYITLLYSTREAEVFLLFLGQLTNEAINFVLKRLIKEERPSHIISSTLTINKAYGMPSSHAQYMAFWAVALGLFLCVRHRPVHKGHPPLKEKGLSKTIEAYSHSPWSLAQRVVATVGAVFIAGLVSWSRVYLGYHTVKQVVAGSAAGIVSGVAWFAVTYLMRETGFLVWLLEFPVARWLRIRDLVVEEDICQAGWEKWEERRVRQIKEQEGKKNKKNT
ncbi:PAP2 superfamily-domain-containing protein [Podospora fimiseda]|uniref:Dolichyldiphosphatase n=1 Tax=Podospora fimiseda TaxID=252190 RepID=A0AAN7BRJ9_9PEZI|nr:PAP2 superfamily-domain-containing protein [Podospora fimiseda]